MILDRYAVFGNPIAHSKSPRLQSLFAAQTGEDIQYTAQLVDKDHFTPAADAFFASGGKGLNITVPFKEDAFHYAKQLTPRAQLAGAVNTLLVASDGTITGDNTDGAGIVDDMRNNLDWQLYDKTILIVGAGGAVRGIIEPLIKERPNRITIVNRTVEKAQALCDMFSSQYSAMSACGFDELKSSTAFDIVINGTSASLSGELPPLPASIVHAQSACYDMMYGADKTIFMRWAEQAGAKHIADGLGMLVCQGAESFKQWRGKTPETSSVIATIRRELTR